LLLLLTTAASPRLKPRETQGQRHSATTWSSPSRKSNPTLCCLHADPHPLLAACLTRYSDVTFGRFAGDKFGCLLSRHLIASRPFLLAPHPTCPPSPNSCALCCLPADPHPSLDTCLTRYSDDTLGRLADDTFGCLLSRPLTAPRPFFPACCPVHQAPTPVPFVACMLTHTLCCLSAYPVTLNDTRALV
jgi:hypothetical protein